MNEKKTPASAPAGGDIGTDNGADARITGAPFPEPSGAMNAFSHAPDLRLVPAPQLTASPKNPRTRFDAATIAELAESIRVHGILEPLIVRPIPADRIAAINGGARFEIVAGHRRQRAAALAGLADLPVIVRELADDQVAEIQLIENLQKESLHPLEEAAGFRALMDDHGRTAEAVADKIGKSREYIFGRLKLLDLSAESRAAWMAPDSKLTASTALLVARLPAILQGEAIERITLGIAGELTEPLPYRQAAQVVRQQFMLAIKGAPFDVKATYTEPALAGPITLAPPCAQCPKRTHAAADLFNPADGPDMCMDRTCYQAKEKAAQRAMIDKARADGRLVIEGKAAKKAKPDRYSNLVGFVRPGDYCYDLPGSSAPYKKLVAALGDDAPPLAILLDPHDDDAPIECYDKSRMHDALKKAGFFDKPEPGEEFVPGNRSTAALKTIKARGEDPKARAAREAAELAEATRLEIFKTLRGAMAAEIERCAGLPFEDTVREIARTAGDVYQDNGSGYEAMAAARGDHDVSYGWLLREIMDAPSMPALFLLMWEMTVADAVFDTYHDRKADPLLREAARLAIDVGAIEASVKKARAPADPPPAAEPAAKPAKAGKAKRAPAGTDAIAPPGAALNAITAAFVATEASAPAAAKPAPKAAKKAAAKGKTAEAAQ